MQHSAPGRAVAAVLDPVLEPAGFAPGQHGDVDEGQPTQVVFCAGHDELSDRYPLLPQADEQPRGQGACVDLVVGVGADGTIEHVELEGPTLAETLRRVGLDADADAVASVEGRPALEALPVVEAALRRLFASSA